MGVPKWRVEARLFAATAARNEGSRIPHRPQPTALPIPASSAGGLHSVRSALMPQTINTNITSLNAQRNLNTVAVVARDVDAAPVVGPARQLGQGRRRRPGDRRAHERADPRHERRRSATPTTASRWRRPPKARWQGRPTRCSACASWRCRRRTARTAPSDRANLDTEYQQLPAEITRVAAQTKFNGSASRRRRRRADLPGRRQQRRHA